MQNFLIFVEGETEGHLLKKLQVIGKIQKINLWDTNVNKHLRRFKPNTLVYVVYDTDVAHSSANINRFNSNLAVLQSNKVLGGIVQQTFNFEDELVIACSELKNSKALFKVFNAVNANEFKSQFLKASNILSILVSQGFDCSKLWQQPMSPYIDERYRDKHVALDKLPKR